MSKCPDKCNQDHFLISAGCTQQVAASLDLELSTSARFVALDGIS